MTRKDQKGMDPTQFMDAVVKNSTRFWEGMAGFTWPGKDTSESNKEGGTASGSFDPWEPAMETWKQFQESCSPETFADPFKMVHEEGFKQFEKATKEGWEKLLSMGGGLTPPFSWAQSPFSWAQAPFGVGASELFGGKDTFKEILKLMSGEMNRFISIPPLGLSRNYQGKVVDVVDKGNQFLLTLGEYMFLMFSPLEQAMQMVQATVKGLSDEERQSLTPESVYETWLKELEQGYFTLYGSEEYLGILKRLVSAMGEFNLARQNYMSDCLKLMGIPSESDLDDLYRDLYSLKKKISSLENVIEKMAQSANVAKAAEKSEAPVKEAKPAEKVKASVKEAPKSAAPKSTKTAEASGKAAPKAQKEATPKVAAKRAGKAGKPQKQASKPAGKTP